MQLSEKIKEIRELANMNQDQFAKAIGVDQSMVSNWERGKAEPTAVNLLKLAKFNHSSVDELLDNIVFSSDSISPKLLHAIKGLTPEEQKLLACFLESIMNN